MMKIIGKKVRNKYGARKTFIDGIKFDSQKEGRRYTELKLLQRAKKITDLDLQPKFELQEKFKHDGKSIRAIHYVADFIYKQDGQTIIEDVKGMKTDVYKIKCKMFKYKYPQYVFKET